MRINFNIIVSWAIKSNHFVTLARKTVFTRSKVLKRGTFYFILGSYYEKVLYNVLTRSILGIARDHVKVYLISFVGNSITKRKFMVHITHI